MTAERAPMGLKHLPRVDEEDDLSIEYPSSDGKPMAESDFQYIPMTDTIAALRNWFIDRADVYVAGDMLIYYRMNDNSIRVAPDVFVVFGAAGNHPRDSWLVWREGRAPDFVMEIASVGTWRQDAREKRDIYANMGVTEYWRFDPTGRCFSPALIGETLANGVYRVIPHDTDDAGILRRRSAVLGMDICSLPGRELRLYDPASGQWLLTPRESEEARRVAEAALRESEAARRAAEEEIRLLREQLRAAQSGQ